MLRSPADSHAVWHATDADGHPLFCTRKDCGYPVEAFAGDLPSYAAGRLPHLCAECRLDWDVLAVTRPHASVVAARAAAGERRRQAANTGISTSPTGQSPRPSHRP
ncbi:MAG: hypothetical protein PGN13_16460 [Patulibacter minatonensis]